MIKILFLTITAHSIFAMNPPLAQPKPRKPSAPLVHNEQIHTVSSDAQSDWELKLEEQLILPTLIGTEIHSTNMNMNIYVPLFIKNYPK